MKVLKTVVVLLFSVSLLLGCNSKDSLNESSQEAEQQKETHFRDFSWGANEEEIMEKESAELSVNIPTRKVYKGVLYDLDTSIEYLLEDGGLVSGVYHFDVPYDVMNPDKFIKDYDMLENHLKQKYGEPQQKVENWKQNADDNSKERTSYRAVSVTSGLLEQKTLWLTDSSEITLSLRRNSNTEVYHNEKDYQEVKFELIYKQKHQEKI